MKQCGIWRVLNLNLVKRILEKPHESKEMKLDHSFLDFSSQPLGNIREKSGFWLISSCLDICMILLKNLHTLFSLPKLKCRLNLAKILRKFLTNSNPKLNWWKSNYIIIIDTSIHFNKRYAHLNVVFISLTISKKLIFLKNTLHFHIFAN